MNEEQLELLKRIAISTEAVNAKMDRLIVLMKKVAKEVGD